MLNLLKFREKALYADGRVTDATGAEAYGIYSQETADHVEKVGGKILFNGSISRLMLGEVGELWDTAALVMYPSRKAMLAMIQDQTYQASAIHRSAGLDGQLNLEVKAGLVNNLL
jgi:uncharacterized protein (DUF1330 family)